MLNLRLKAASASSVPQGPVSLMYRVYKYILPEVRAQLAEWKLQAEAIPDLELRTQALASIATKQFHCEGGGVYAAMSMNHRHVLVPLIVALQTISDYLDNLCDRSTSMDGHDFRQLHMAMLDAIDPQAPLKDYYALHSEKEDGGYLANLVRTCQSCVCMLPGYQWVYPHVRELVSYYCDLQVHKHIQHDQRESALLGWWQQHQAGYPEIKWNEFAAATGSTVGVFMLFASATNPKLESQSAERIRSTYFPYVCGLHILLDYLIDQEEDELGGDLNFCSYYKDDTETFERFVFVVDKARENIVHLEHASFHRMIVEGLLALYLSDPKVSKQQRVRNISRQLMRKSPLTRIFFWLNSHWIRKMMY